MERLWIACLHVQIKQDLAHNIVASHLWETKPMEGDLKWTDQRGVHVFSSDLNTHGYKRKTETLTPQNRIKRES